jgi:hypothetical protein
LHAQNKKFDSTIKWDRTGYRVICKNKNGDNNDVSITMYGFAGSGSSDISFKITGRVVNAAVDDFNSDGYPDLIFFTYDINDRGQVYALASLQNKTCIPILIDDIYNVPALREGYQGHDEFTVLNGLLSRKFPVYHVDSLTKESKITGYRHVLYKVDTDHSNPEMPRMKFKVFSNNEVKK